MAKKTFTLKKENNMSTQFQLLKEQRFKPYFFTQFLSAFNDNTYKTALVTLVAFHASTLGNMDNKAVATLLPGIFMLPYFLFSATAGQMADKFERSAMIRMIKLIEIGIMTLASAGFYLNHLGLLIASLFLMGTHSTFFGPLKFAYLPQHLNEKELMGGNGMVEMGSFVAILLGQILGAWLGAQSNHALLTSITIVMVALIGYHTSRSIPRSPAPEPQLAINWNPVTETYRNLAFTWQHQSVWLAVIAISWFWFYGATIVAQFPMLAVDVLHGNESVFILLLAMFSLGVGTGSLLCEKITHGKVEIGLVLFGGIGMSVFGADLYAAAELVQQQITTFNYASFMSFNIAGALMRWRLLLDVTLLGMFGGFFIVPLYALIQTQSDKSHLSRIIAGNNIVNALFMVASAGASVLFLKHGYSIPQLILATAMLNIVVMIYLCWRNPAFWVRFKAWGSQIIKPKTQA